MRKRESMNHSASTGGTSRTAARHGNVEDVEMLKFDAAVVQTILRYWGLEKRI